MTIGAGAGAGAGDTGLSTRGRSLEGAGAAAAEAASTACNELLVPSVHVMISGASQLSSSSSMSAQLDWPPASSSGRRRLVMCMPYLLMSSSSDIFLVSGGATATGWKEGQRPLITATRDVCNLRRLRFQTVLASGAAADFPFVVKVLVEPPRLELFFATSFSLEA